MAVASPEQQQQWLFVDLLFIKKHIRVDTLQRRKTDRWDNKITYSRWFCGRRVAGNTTNHCWLHITIILCDIFTSNQTKHYQLSRQISALKIVWQSK
ncbi:unnamed protein product [Lactuca saligna]|uniref:Uncharacterized protein n=1 Tax=Lactuca saligna TaxID=75948 RepID=A0AA35Y9Z9_LACSI|nr:unnamed protein product [Lactuca saligna]